MCHAKEKREVKNRLKCCSHIQRDTSYNCWRTVSNQSIPAAANRAGTEDRRCRSYPNSPPRVQNYCPSIGIGFHAPPTLGISEHKYFFLISHGVEFPYHHCSRSDKSSEG